METTINDQIEQWRAEVAERPLQSAQQVQDRLLDLYGAIKAYPVASQVEGWLKLSRERSLFENSEITELLDEIEVGLQFEERPQPAGA